MAMLPCSGAAMPYPYEAEPCDDQAQQWLGECEEEKEEEEGKEGKEGTEGKEGKEGKDTRERKEGKVKKAKKENKQGKKHQIPVDDVWPRPYLVQNGLRRVEPYEYTYRTSCKERWRGRQLLDVFEAEFRDRPVAYYRQAMETGKVRVNDEQVRPEYVLRNGDMVSHAIHRHEPPVSAEAIGIIHEDEDMIVINKPSGIPVHPAGRYNFNSVVELMKLERGRDFKAYPCNRLDRLTSGLMLVAKTAKAAERVSFEMARRSVRKEYVARVIGEFPDQVMVCDQPILQISPKLGLNRVRASGRQARTVFKKLAYCPPPPAEGSEVDGEEGGEKGVGGSDGKAEHAWTGKEGYSIVRCMPVTGRTHQIRVHLQHLGFPIQNDPIYANQRVWGFNLGQGDAEGRENSDEDVMARLSRMGKEDVADAVAYHDEMVDDYYRKKAEKMSGERCDVCDTPLYTDPGEQELSLWLHSLRYEEAGGAWSYTSPLPEWALPTDPSASGPRPSVTVGAMDELVEAVKDTDPEIAGDR